MREQNTKDGIDTITKLSWVHYKANEIHCSNVVAQQMQPTTRLEPQKGGNIQNDAGRMILNAASCILRRAKWIIDVGWRTHGRTNEEMSWKIRVAHVGGFVIYFPA